METTLLIAMVCSAAVAGVCATQRKLRQCTVNQARIYRDLYESQDAKSNTEHRALLLPI